MVPPRWRMVDWSSISEMTGWWVAWANSVLLASSSPSTLRANSITAHCMPRQMPKKGMPRVRA